MNSQATKLEQEQTLALTKEALRVASVQVANAAIKVSANITSARLAVVLLDKLAEQLTLESIEELLK